MEGKNIDFFNDFLTTLETYLYKIQTIVDHTNC